MTFQLLSHSVSTILSYAVVVMALMAGLFLFVAFLKGFFVFLGVVKLHSLKAFNAISTEGI